MIARNALLLSPVFFLACLERPARSSGRAAAPTPALPAGSIHALAPAPLAPAPSTLVERVREWIARTPGAEAFRDGVMSPAPEHDTAQLRCVRVTVAAAPDPARATRLICVAGDEILAAEPGYQRYLQIHQFDARLARPAAEHLLALRDAMLGHAGREYRSIEAHVEGDALVIDAEGTERLALSRPARFTRWRVTIERDGASRELVEAPAQ